MRSLPLMPPAACLPQAYLSSPLAKAGQAPKGPGAGAELLPSLDAAIGAIRRNEAPQVTSILGTIKVRARRRGRGRGPARLPAC